MIQVSLTELSPAELETLARVTFAAARPHGPAWLPDLDAAREELEDARADNIHSRVLLDGARRPLGWIAASHQWGRLWEIHPLVIAVDHQARGHGRTLVAAIEAIAAAQGALTMWVGTSDTTGSTSLSGVDLYDDPIAALAAAHCREPHAFGFWLRVGYKLVGVAPDAEGPGVPSICLAKRLRGPETPA